MRVVMTAAFLLLGLSPANAQYLGNYTANATLPPAPPQLPGTFNNPFGNNNNSPQLYDSQGNFHGNLNSNQFDPDSVANPFGRYGSQFSPDSINNPFGAGSQFSPDSPYNQFGQGMRVYGPNE
jgi:hypothetical protein